MSTSSITEQARLLCAHIRALKAVHRNGLTPSFGQVEELFDRADDLHRVLGTAADAPVVQRCTRPSCGRESSTRVGPLPYCQTCGDAARQLLRNLESFGVSSPVSVFWPAGQTRALDSAEGRD